MPAVTLLSKPDAVLAYEMLPGDAASSLLVIFLNGLGLPQSAWKPTIELFQQQSTVSPKPWLLTYDRYGQGGSSRDPRESWPTKDPGYAHTLDDVSHHCRGDPLPRLQPRQHQLRDHLAESEGPVLQPRADDTPGTTLEVYQAAYTKMCMSFSGHAKNVEGFDRRDIKDMLPDPSSPKLKGPKDWPEKGPWITVVGHELEQFSQEEWSLLKVPIGMAAMYTQPAKGPLIAPKSGHFIQKDNPLFVAKELQDLVEKVEASSAERVPR
ncbi:alpha/beta-Hydrolase [Apiospora rasikravindrae]|uniref:Alpha/beta-Hydrolase n=1 Tax=Apiospora rasikravindrae TaxID=990691 RepID=A0ABR1TG05_9PEZI